MHKHREIFCYCCSESVSINTTVGTNPLQSLFLSSFPSCKIMKTFTAFALHALSNKLLICGSCQTQNAINDMWSKSRAEADFLIQLRNGSGIDFVHQSEIQTNILFVMVKTGRLLSFMLWGGGCCEREETH